MHDDPGPAANPYQAPLAEGPPIPAPPPLGGSYLSLSATGLGALGGGVLGCALGWWLLIGPNPGPGFHITFPLILGGAAISAVLGGGAGFLVARKVRGKSNRSATLLVTGLILASAGLAFLVGSLTSGPFLEYQTRTVRNPDGTFTTSTQHRDFEFGGLLTLAGAGLALWGWRRHRPSSG